MYQGCCGTSFLVTTTVVAGWCSGKKQDDPTKYSKLVPHNKKNLLAYKMGGKNCIIFTSTAYGLNGQNVLCVLWCTSGSNNCFYSFKSNSCHVIDSQVYLKFPLCFTVLDKSSLCTHKFCHLSRTVFGNTLSYDAGWGQVKESIVSHSSGAKACLMELVCYH